MPHNRSFPSCNQYSHLRPGKDIPQPPGNGNYAATTDVPHPAIILRQKQSLAIEIFIARVLRLYEQDRREPCGSPGWMCASGGGVVVHAADSQPPFPIQPCIASRAGTSARQPWAATHIKASAHGTRLGNATTSS